MHAKEFRENLADALFPQLLACDTVCHEWSASRHSDATGYGLVAVEC